MRILKVILILFPTIIFCQPNCNAFKDSICKKACEIAVNAEQYQGHKFSQMDFDKAIEMCPNFDYAYREKSVPYLKRGDFITWKKIIDKAVDVNPSDNLGYRGWCKYQFLRDYQGALIDLEALEKINKDNIGYSQNGDYHLKIVIALCYKSLGKKEKAINLIKEQLSVKNYTPQNYDYLHLGILYYETGNIKEAIKSLKKEITLNDYLAETYFYLALAYKKEKKTSLSKENLLKAKDFYNKGFSMKDNYTNPLDKIYLKQIENLLK